MKKTLLVLLVVVVIATSLALIGCTSKTVKVVPTPKVVKAVFDKSYLDLQVEVATVRSDPSSCTVKVTNIGEKNIGILYFLKGSEFPVGYTLHVGRGSSEDWVLQEGESLRIYRSIAPVEGFFRTTDFLGSIEAVKAR